MLETACRQGHARTADWRPSQAQHVRTPELIIPDVPQTALPEWTRITVTAKPQGDGRPGVIELVSGGTWFHPADATPETGLVVPAPQPVPTAQVQVLDIGDEVAVFHDAGGWSRDPSRLVPAWIDARMQATPGRLFWAPALGTPADYALWTYLGADLFDASPLMLAAMRGEVLTVDGVCTAEEMEILHPGTWDVDRIMAHNLEAARQELAMVRLALAQGRLRALVERRIYTSAHSVEVLRRFDAEHAFLESAAPRHLATPVPCMTQESLWMPEVRAFRRRLRERYRPPTGSDVLVLLPCSARKPYRLSPSHRRIARALDDSGIRHRVHEVMITSPLGVVPRELENTFPAQHYDVPVTGSWTRDEGHIIRQQVQALLEAGDYQHVIVHVGPGTFGLIRDLVPDAVHTASTHATAFDDLQALREALQALPGPRSDPRAGGRRQKVAFLEALLSFQFGPEAATALCADAKAMGKWPYIKLLGPEGQRGQTTPERGMLSLTLDGARIVAAHSPCRVHIGDFQPRKTSSLFAVGVASADPGVRVGEEVVIVHGSDVRGCGVAQMSADEMAAMKRGVAVTLRHGGA